MLVRVFVIKQLLLLQMYREQNGKKKIMKNAFTFLLLLLNLNGFSQSEAYYINSSRGHLAGDILLISYTSNSHAFKKSYSFKDSVIETNVQESPFIHLNHSQIPSTKTDSIPSNPFFNTHLGPISVNTTDSIQINQKWYTLKFHFDDDRFIGGRQNAVNKTIWVSDLGTIYSYNTNFSAHELVMLCQKDSVKQMVLNSIFKHLKKTNNWFNWSKLSRLSTQYNFSMCITKLTKEWNKDGSALIILSTTSTTKNGMITYDVTLKDNSNTAYVLPNYYSISPASATVFNQDSTTYNWDLIDTHYRRHFKQVNFPHYILPNQEINFTQNLSIKTGTGNKLIYHGFQLFSQRTFFNWILSEDVLHEGTHFKIYSHRQFFE